MIFKKENITLYFSNSSFWTTDDIKSKKTVVNGRRYKIRSNHGTVTIERKINSFFDLFGYTNPLKRLGIAKGTTTKETGQTIVNLAIGLKGYYKFVLIATYLFCGLFCVLILINNISDWLAALLLFISPALLTFEFNRGVKLFKAELENDIDYFK
ncbi:MAG: hypothetical protein AAFZ15_14400 [Bacteroidota bacterium]